MIEEKTRQRKCRATGLSVAPGYFIRLGAAKDRNMAVIPIPIPILACLSGFRMFEIVQITVAAAAINMLLPTKELFRYLISNRATAWKHETRIEIIPNAIPKIAKRI
jgi:hypothetical protein